MAASKSVTITTRISAPLAKRLEAYAKAAKRTRSWVVQDLLEQHLDSEIELLKAVREGVEAANRGELISHEEAVRHLRAHIANRKRERRKAA
jgi:predicted transcriptional regulator